jgi:hypothetical protein
LALLVSWCGCGDGVGRGEVSVGDGGGAEPLGGVLGLNRHLQQGPHELPRIQLWYEIQSQATVLYPLLVSYCLGPWMLLLHFLLL